MPLDDNYDGLEHINGAILIVTDDIDVNIVLGGIFSVNGFKCTSAQEALEILEKYVGEINSMLVNGHIAADRGAMIILKSKMIKPSIKIVVLANNDSAKTRVLSYGADDFLIKPTSAETLTNRVITQLARRQQVS